METNAKARPETVVAHPHGSKGAILSVDIASQKAIAAARVVSGWEKLSLLEATGRICCYPVKSGLDLPVFANSAMDGYAINRHDLTGVGPWTLPVSGRLVAGAGHVTPLAPGSAVRIMTGAPIPGGADCVVMQEHCERRGNAIMIREMPEHGKNIRLRGEDVRSGSVLVDAGCLLTPRHQALLAACGSSEVSVHAKVRIGLISTGS
ncbi:MAG: molybdopterin molybdenumtransferase MoeA, partial [Hoeflea sp.]|nr:molybdopterin molybdenumtransferase MoeA [Hoeflea sp.]